MARSPSYKRTETPLPDTGSGVALPLVLCPTRARREGVHVMRPPPLTFLPFPFPDKPAGSDDRGKADEADQHADERHSHSPILPGPPGGSLASVGSERLLRMSRIDVGVSHPAAALPEQQFRSQYFHVSPSQRGSQVEPHTHRTIVACQRIGPNVPALDGPISSIQVNRITSNYVPDLLSVSGQFVSNTNCPSPFQRAGHLSTRSSSGGCGRRHKAGSVTHVP